MDLPAKVVGAVGLALAVAGLLWLFEKGKRTRWFAALMSRTGPQQIKFIRNWGPLSGIVLLLGALVAYFYAENQPGARGLEEARIGFAGKTLAQAIDYCRSLPNFPRYDAPLVIAWQSQALHWYLLEGADNASMRHHSCDGSGGLAQGERYERVMLKRVPMDGRRPSRAMPKEILFDRYAQAPDAGLAALEAALDPVTGALVERRWLASGSVQTSGGHARDLPALLTHAPAGLASATYPQRTLRVPTDWTQTPQAVFALLEKHVLPTQRIAMLHFRQKDIQVTVAGPIEVDDQPAAAFGKLNFDSHGVADEVAWAPALAVESACTLGRSLGEVKALLFAQQPGPKLTIASFGCGQKKPGGQTLGEWRLRDYDQRN